MLPPVSNALVNSLAVCELAFVDKTSEISDKLVMFNILLDTLLSVHDVIDDIVW